MGNSPSSDDNMTKVTTAGNNANEDDDVFVDSNNNNNGIAPSDDVTKALSVLLRPRASSSGSYTTPKIVTSLRPQIDAGLRRSSLISSSTLDLSSATRRSSISTPSCSYDLASRRSMSFMSLADRSVSISDDDPDGGGTRRPSFRRQESLIESIERQRRESISRKLREIREAAPTPSATRCSPTLRRSPLATIEAKSMSGETSSTADATVPRVTPVYSMPMIPPLNRSVSANESIHKWLPVSRRVVGDGSGMPTVTGSGPMRAVHVVAATSGRRPLRPSADEDRTSTESSASTRQAPKWTNSKTEEADQSWRRLNIEPPRVSDKMPTLTGSAQRQFSRPIWRAASFDSLYQTSTDANDNSTLVKVIATHQPEAGEDRASVAAMNVQKSEDSERTAEKVVTKPEVVAIGDQAVDDTDVSSSAPLIPPPSPPTFLHTESCLDENAHLEMTGEKTITVGAVAVPSPVTRDGDLFEDIGEAEVSQSFGGESTMIPRSAFCKPRPPLARRSRPVRSPSPDATTSEAATTTTTITMTARVPETSPETCPCPIVTNSCIDEASVDDEDEQARVQSIENHSLSSMCSSGQLSSDAELNNDHYTADKPDVHRDSFFNVTEPNGDMNDVARSDETSENGHVRQPYPQNDSDDVNLTTTMTPHSDSDEALPSLRRQLTDDSRQDDSGTLDSGYLTPIDGLGTSLDDVRHNYASEEQSLGDVEHSDRINDRLRPKNDTILEHNDLILASYIIDDKSTEALGRAAIIGVVDGSPDRHLTTVQPTMQVCARVSASDLPESKSEIRGQTVTENFTSLDRVVDGSNTFCPSGFGEKNAASSVPSTDDEYVTADDELRSSSTTDGAMNNVSWSNLDQVEIFDDDNEERRENELDTTAMVNGGLDEEIVHGGRSTGTTMNKPTSRRETRIVENGYEVLDFMLNKDCVGIGFCIEGGENAGGRRNPITIKRMFKGETWAKGLLQAGDEIISVNDQSFGMLSHYDAWNVLKAVPDGLVHIQIGRHVNS